METKHLMRSLLGKALSLGLSLIMTGSVFALGLGNVSGQAILGQPLHIEIPLLGSDEGTPSVECFKVRQPATEIENDFVLRNAQIQLVDEHGRAKLIVTTSTPVREPVIEFGMAIGCGFELSRDYLLLTSEPSDTTPATLPIIPTALTPAESQSSTETPAQRPIPTLPVAPTDKLLRIESDVTLKTLAQQKYPLQPKAREKFMRMMTQANPELIQDGDLIAAGSELQLPPGLPVRRLGAYRPEAKPALTDHGATQPNIPSSQSSTNKKPTARAAKPHQDFLVLGAPAQRSATELLAEAERLTALLIEQTNAQNAAADKITQLEDTLNALKKNFNGLESRVNRIEMERQAEKLEARPASLDFVGLLLAVLAGGAIGGLTLHLYNRMRMSRSQGLNHSGRTSGLEGGIPAVPPNPPAPLKAKAEGLPWERKAGSTDQIGTAKMAEKLEQQRFGGNSYSPVNELPSSPQNDFDFVSKPSP